jgi:hypothetical protein
LSMGSTIFLKLSTVRCAPNTPTLVEPIARGVTKLISPSQLVAHSACGGAKNGSF